MIHQPSHSYGTELICSDTCPYDKPPAVAALVPPPAPLPAEGTLAERLVAALSPLAGSSSPGELPGLVPLLLTEAAREPELSGLRDTFVERVTGGVVALVRAAAADGTLEPSTEPVESASRLLGPVMFHRFLTPTGADPAFVERTVALFLRASTPAPAAASTGG